MSSILHFEPLRRQIAPPLAIGHSECVEFGSKLCANPEEEEYAPPAASILMGAPLIDVTQSPAMDHVPLVKTIESVPDPDSDQGHIFCETLHFRTSDDLFIPIRHKVRSMSGGVARFTHLPSLNAVRQRLGGWSQPVADPRFEIINEMVLYDRYFHNNARHPIVDFVRDELLPAVSHATATPLHFDTHHVHQMVDTLVRDITNTPWEMNKHHLRMMLPNLVTNIHHLPVDLTSTDPVIVSLHDLKSRVQSHGVDLRSWGRIDISTIPRVDINPFRFRRIAELLDACPLTDLNIEAVVGVDNEIHMVPLYMAIDRLAEFSHCHQAVDDGDMAAEQLIHDVVNAKIMDLVFEHHTALTNEQRDILNTQAVKLKIIKTLSDEALILLYRGGHTPTEEPLCAIYFDFALMSLAPLSIIHQPIFN